MSMIDYLLLAAIICAVAAAVRHRSRHKGCGGGCEGCASCDCCAAKKDAENKAK